MKSLLFSFLLLPFFCCAQSHHHTVIAPAHTFQLVIPTAKYLDMYAVLVTDSLLEVIEKKRKQNENSELTLSLGMKILILSKAKVEQGVRIPKIEIVRIH
jgi:hypothetical protein